jgi:uncharacterized membrane protein SpoIIM required for sporulation
MFISSILNIVGLSFDIIGVILLFIFGLPPDVIRGGHQYYASLEVDKNEKRKAAIYDNISRVALILIIIGFIFQLLSGFSYFDISFYDFMNGIRKNV